MKEKKGFTAADIVGLACGILLIFFCVIFVLIGGKGQKIGVSGSDIPADAAVTFGTAKGRNGPIKVRVIANDSAIYQIRVVSNEETYDIGKPALDMMGEDIYLARSIDVDTVSGATISSDAMKEAVGYALSAAGIDPAGFAAETDAEAETETDSDS